MELAGFLIMKMKKILETIAPLKISLGVQFFK